MFKSTNIRVENSRRALRALPVGQVLTDEHGNFFQRAEDLDGGSEDPKPVGPAPCFHIAWRDDCYESGFRVERNRTQWHFSFRVLYLAEPA